MVTLAVEITSGTLYRIIAVVRAANFDQTQPVTDQEKQETSDSPQADVQGTNCKQSSMTTGPQPLSEKEPGHT